MPAQGLQATPIACAWRQAHSACAPILPQIDVTQAWLTFSSVILAFTFIFGNSIRTVFE